MHHEQPPIQMQDWNIVPVPSEPLLILSDIYVLLVINKLYIMVCGQWQQNLSILVLCVVHVQTNNYDQESGYTIKLNTDLIYISPPIHKF